MSQQYLAVNGRADAGDDGSIDGEICGERGGKYLAGLGVVGVQLVGGLDQDVAAGRERDHLRGLRRRSWHRTKGKRGYLVGRIGICDSIRAGELNSLRSAGDELAVDYLAIGQAKRVGRSGERQREAESG